MSYTHNCSALLNVDEHSCMNCQKKKHSLLNDLSLEELIILNNKKYDVSYKAGETICKQGTKPPGLLCLHMGKVKIVHKGLSGNEQIVALKKPVDFIGFRALMGQNSFLTSAIALEETKICVLDKQDFFKVVGNNSDLSFKIIKHLADKLNETYQRQLDITQKHLRGRLADALLMVYNVYGTSNESDILDVRLKRSELARMSNMTTANAIRILSAFVKEDLVEVDKRKIKILNLLALRRISAYGN